MKNLSTTTTTFSGALMARQSLIDSCTTVEQVRSIVRDIVDNAVGLRPSAREYGDKVWRELKLKRHVNGALLYIYNIILAGDCEGCLHTEEAKQRKRGYHSFW